MKKYKNIEYSIEKLDNGLTICHIKKKGFNVKGAFLRVFAGGIDHSFTLDDVKYDLKSGVAHYIEHLLFTNPDGTDSFELLDRLGADSNAQTSTTDTDYYFSCVSNFEEALNIFLNFILTPYFPAHKVSSERNIILREYESAFSSPYRKIISSLFKKMYSDSTLGESTIGTIDDINQITEYDLYSFYEAYYSYSNMMLVLFGDYDISKINNVVYDIISKHPHANHKVERNYNHSKVLAKTTTIEADIDYDKCVMAYNIELNKSKYENYNDIVNISIVLDMLFSTSNPLYYELLNEGIIKEDFDFFLEYNDAIATIVFMTSSVDCEKTKEVLHNIILKRDRKYISDDDYQLIKKNAIGDHFYTLEKILDLADTIINNYNDGVDFTKSISYINSKSLDEVLKSFEIVDLNSLNCVFYKKS